jgi:hypothetical protein
MRITFSHIKDGIRVPLKDEQGREVVKYVDAPDKSAAVADPEIVTFCQQNNCRVRRVD